MGYFDVLSSKMALVFKFRASMTSLWRHYDVIIGNMEGLVTLSFFEVERQNLVSWGILMRIFQKNYLFLKFKASMALLWRHNRCILERPCNLAIFEGRSSKFCKLYSIFFLTRTQPGTSIEISLCYFNNFNHPQRD